MMPAVLLAQAGMAALTGEEWRTLGPSIFFRCRCRNRWVAERHSGSGEQGARPLQGRRIPVQYLLLIYTDDAGWTKLTQAEQERGMAAYHAFNEALTKAGVLKSANHLQPAST